MENKREVFSYIAGIIDGEGCITMRTDNPSECVIIRMNESDALNIIHDNFGGSLTKAFNKKYNSWTYQYLVANKKANNLLKEIYPFLVIKRDHADRCFELRETIEKYKKGEIDF